MHRPLTRAQALENAAFLRALRRTGNVREAARTVGVANAVLYRRRRAHPDFAQRWDAAQAVAQARLHARGAQDAPIADERGLRTMGGEPVVMRGPEGRLQVRRCHPGKVTRACEQAFLSALSATANVALSAAAAGVTPVPMYQRRRRNPGFAREWRLALERGYERIEQALLAGFRPDAQRDDAWRHNDPPPIPPMTANQALQLLYLHQKEARLRAEPPHLKRRRGESGEAHSLRLAEMYKEAQRRDREAFEIAEAARRSRGEPCLTDQLSTLPDLSQVTGWSRATGAGEGSDRALFGGRRLGEG